MLTKWRRYANRSGEMVVFVACFFKCMSSCESLYHALLDHWLCERGSIILVLSCSWRTFLGICYYFILKLSRKFTIHIFWKVTISVLASLDKDGIFTPYLHILFRRNWAKFCPIINFFCNIYFFITFIGICSQFVLLKVSIN